MTFSFQPSENNDMIHWALGSTKENHKYVSRKKVNGRWVYTYTKTKTDLKSKIKYGFKDGYETGTGKSDIKNSPNVKKNVDIYDRAFDNTIDKGYDVVLKDRDFVKGKKVARNLSRIEEQRNNEAEAATNVAFSIPYKIARQVGATTYKVKKKKK